MTLPLNTQKIFDYLKQLLADGKEISLSLDEIKKKAKTPNILNGTVSALIKREQKKGNFKNLTVKQFSAGAEVGKSKHDADYKNNKKFRDFYNKTYKTPWNEIDQKTNLKANSYTAFLLNQKLVKDAKGFTLTPEEMAKKLGISLDSLRTYEAKPTNNTSSRFIADNIKKERTVGVNPTTGLRETVVRYKDPGKNILKNWNVLQESSIISKKMVDNVKEYDKLFRDQLKSTKELPEISEVIERTSMKTPTTIANTEALYSRLLRGETFRSDVGIARDAVLGKKIMDELAIDSANNSRRSAFYNLALDNINKMYPNESGNLETFKTRFRTELRKALGLKKTQAVPFSVNEVISLSAGETRGIQPFSVFVDAVETNINKNELRNYQGQFSKKLDKVQQLLSGSEPKVAEAEKIALSLDSSRNTLINRLTKKGFTTSQINQLNLPDIKVGENVLETYKAKDLSRFKKVIDGKVTGVDIAQFAKDKGYYIDIKKAKPFWESNVTNTIVEAAKNNTGNVCNIFKGKIAYSADGGRIGFGGGCAKEMADAMEADAPGTLKEVSKTKGVLPKFQNVATKFLQSPLLKKGGKFGAIAAAGAAAAGLVKTFMNDDPTTYLSNEDQQKNMLISMVTNPIDETPEESPEILDWQLPTLGAVTAAGMVPGGKRVYDVRRRGGPNLKPANPVRSALGLKGVLGKGLAATATPLGLLALEPLHLAGQIQPGDSPTEIATNPLNYLGPTFASGLTKEATRFTTPMVSKIMRMGMSPTALKGLSRFGGYGLAASLGIQGLMKFDDWRNKRGWFSEE